MNTVEFVDGGEPGISAALLNEPFHVKGASYAEGIITVTIGPGRVDYGVGTTGIIEKLTDSTLTISSPAINTTYYIFIGDDDKFSYNVSSIPGAGKILLGSVATGNPVSVLTRDDLRGMLPGAIRLLDVNLNKAITGSTQVDRSFYAASANGYDYTTGSGIFTQYINHINSGPGNLPSTSGGQYSLAYVIQELVKRSHTHSIERHNYNCDCDCTCN